MNKFKVGDRVRVKPIYYGVEERNNIGYIHEVDVANSYQVVFKGTKNVIPLIPGEYLELVEPGKYEIGQKVDDILDACKYVMREEKYDYDKYILGVRSGKDRAIMVRIAEEIAYIPTEYKLSLLSGKPIFQRALMETLEDFKYYHFSLEDKKRLPDEVIFKDGKTTLLFSIKNDGKEPYNSYSSKVAKGDKFDKEFGFLITYLKYLKENHKDILKEMFGFEAEIEDYTNYLQGIVRQILDENDIDFKTYREYLSFIINNERYTLKQYHDFNLKIITKAKRHNEVANEIEAKEKELDKLKKQKENLK